MKKSIKKDLTNNTDIKLLVDCFYEKIKKDNSLSYIFSDVAKTNWEKHLPVMYRFWENLLFYSGTYEGNPMELHQKLHHFSNLRPSYFDHWIELFNSTVDELFKGKVADMAKQRASSIAAVMKIKLFPQAK